MAQQKGMSGMAGGKRNCWTWGTAHVFSFKEHMAVLFMTIGSSRSADSILGD